MTDIIQNNCEFKTKNNNYFKEYYQKNKENLIEYAKEYKQINKEKNRDNIKKYNAEYYQKNKEKRQENYKQKKHCDICNSETADLTRHYKSQKHKNNLIKKNQNLT
jgi:hypothetical protein